MLSDHFAVCNCKKQIDQKQEIEILSISEFLVRKLKKWQNIWNTLKIGINANNKAKIKYNGKKSDYKIKRPYLESCCCMRDFFVKL